MKEPNPPELLPPPKIDPPDAGGAVAGDPKIEFPPPPKGEACGLPTGLENIFPPAAGAAADD